MTAPMVMSSIIGCVHEMCQSFLSGCVSFLNHSFWPSCCCGILTFPCLWEIRFSSQAEL